MKIAKNYSDDFSFRFIKGARRDNTGLRIYHDEYTGSCGRDISNYWDYVSHDLSNKEMLDRWHMAIRMLKNNKLAGGIEYEMETKLHEFTSKYMYDCIDSKGNLIPKKVTERKTFITDICEILNIDKEQMLNTFNQNLTEALTTQKAIIQNNQYLNKINQTSK